MAIFGFGKDKEDPADPGLVLACLEEALRLRSPFRFGDGRRETSALVHSVNGISAMVRAFSVTSSPVSPSPRVMAWTRAPAS